MPLKKESQQGEPNETTTPEAVAPEPEEVPAEAAPQPVAQPKPAEPVKPAQGNPDDPRHKFYVTKTGYLRDPTTGIIYITDRPMPGSKSGWLRCQVAAGVIVEYVKGKMQG
jgi:hypothetical protein